jgi:Fur family peroxide stress response transcriptional regulator
MYEISPIEFRELCGRHHLAVTHQRQMIYECLMGMPGHPSPEEIYEKVRRKIPAISLATVYKTIHTFVDSGLLREVSLHHGSLRVESNLHPHHHLVCVRCKSITDIDEQDMDPVRLRRKLQRGFQVQRYAVEILGTCEKCSRAPEQRGIQHVSI